MAWYKCSGGGEGIPLITKSGSIVEYEDSVGGVPVNDLVAQIVATQSGSGDPSPSNVRPISGFTGVNVTRVGKNLFVSSFSKYTRPNDYYICPIPLENGKRYYVSISQITAVTGCAIQLVKSGTRYSEFVTAYSLLNTSGTILNNNFSFIVDDTYTAPAIALYLPNGETSFDSIFEGLNIQLEQGSSATTFEPYSATTYSVSWQTEAGTVYGGTIDLTTGVLTVTHFKYVLDSTNLSTAKRNSAHQFYIMPSALPDIKVTGADYAGGICCDKLKAGTGYSNDDRFFVNSSGAIRWNTTAEFDDVGGMYSAFGDITFIVPLATPQTYQLTPTEVETILGTNYIFADTGDVDVKFYKPVTNLDTLVEQTKNLAPDLLALASAGNGTSTREAFDMTDETTGTKATRIPDYMFYKNLNVEKVNLSTVESVGSNTFYMCPYLTEINLPNATELKSSAFNASSRSLTSPTPMVINLPSVITLNDSALREMGYAGVPTTLTLTACETVSANSVRGASGRYFVIDTLDLPAVKTIGQESFNYHQFTNVIIGTACTSIASKPFNYCTITNLTVKATTPPTLNANGLGCTPTHIYVPADSVATYKAASTWSTYASIIEAIPT